MVCAPEQVWRRLAAAWIRGSVPPPSPSHVHCMASECNLDGVLTLKCVSEPRGTLWACDSLITSRWAGANRAASFVRTASITGVAELLAFMLTLRASLCIDPITSLYRIV